MLIHNEPRRPLPTEMLNHSVIDEDGSEDTVDSIYEEKNPNLLTSLRFSIAV